MVPRETVSFVCPRVLMFPKTKKTKLTSFPSDRILSVLLYIETFPQTVIWQKHAVVLRARATTAQLYPGRDT